MDADTLATWDLAHVWHPFTQQDEWEADSPPLIVERAEGVELIDAHGRRYLDGVASLWTNVHGHRHPHIDEAVRAQLDRVAHTSLLGLASVPAVELARRLVQIAPHGLARVFYSDSGSTAVEVALKIAFQWQQQAGDARRTRFAALQQAYHGDTLGSVSVGGIDLFHAVYRPLLFQAVRLPTPERPDPAAESRCLGEARRILDREGATLAALVYEPLVQGAAGMRMHSPGFLARLLGMARDAGLLLVADEVATGFGRTGTLFATEQVGVVPDMLCLAKGLSGGYLPLAATLVTERIFDGFRGPFQRHRTLFHGHTYTGNPLACAAAIASLDVFERERVIEGLPPKIAALSEALAGLPRDRVAEVRQAGLMAGVALRPPDPAAERHGHRVCMRARAHGVVVRPLGDVVVLMPPLAMRVDQIRRLVDAVGTALREA